MEDGLSIGERVVVAAGMGLALLWASPLCRGRELIPVFCTLMSLAAAHPSLQSWQGGLIASMGVVGGVLAYSCEDQERGLVTGVVAWFSGAIGLAIGHARIDLAAMSVLLALLGLKLNFGRLR